jgi:hypothetical protein
LLKSEVERTDKRYMGAVGVKVDRCDSEHGRNKSTRWLRYSDVEGVGEDVLIEWCWTALS